MNLPEEKRSDFSDIRTTLEHEKLRAEIESLRRSAFRTPQFYAALGPVVFLILGFIISWSNGWFDVQGKKIANDIADLELRRGRLDFETRQKQEEFVRVMSDLNALKKREQELTTVVEKQNSEIAALSSTKKLLEEQLQNLAGADEKAAAYLARTSSLKSEKAQLEAALSESRGRVALFSQYAAIQLRAIVDSQDTADLLLAYANRGRTGPDPIANTIWFRSMWASFLKPEWRISTDDDDAHMRRVIATYGKSAEGDSESKREWSETLLKDWALRSYSGKSPSERLEEEMEELRATAGVKPKPDSQR